jgi:DNA invertase Pin-like site-specific DNA recombinase
MLVGYIRVSTQDQNTDRQVKLLKNKQVEKMFIEKVSGMLSVKQICSFSLE